MGVFMFCISIAYFTGNFTGMLPLLLIFPYLFGIDGVMYTAPIADLAAASVSIVMVVREFKIMAKLQKATA